ncbi:MAG: hypothetical protein F4183_00060 [Rhodothermaceae bacterium]|nr:hypothetical protein [Rhodothermaceae bacterium]
MDRAVAGQLLTKGAVVKEVETRRVQRSIPPPPILGIHRQTVRGLERWGGLIGPLRPHNVFVCYIPPLTT